LLTDYSQCGQAGDVGSVRQQARIGRTIGGLDAATRSWPWQVVVSFRNDIGFIVSKSSLPKVNRGSIGQAKSDTIVANRSPHFQHQRK